VRTDNDKKIKFIKPSLTVSFLLMDEVPSFNSDKTTVERSFKTTLGVINGSNHTDMYIDYNGDTALRGKNKSSKPKPLWTKLNKK